MAQNNTPNIPGTNSPVVNDGTNPIVPLTMAEVQKWNAWLDFRNTGAKQSSSAPSGSVSGNHFNVTGGLTRKLTSDFLVGVVAGFEKSYFDISASSENIKGAGGTGGAYVGWRFAQKLEVSADLAYTSVGYDVTTGSAKGSFTGTHWSGSTGLQGTYELNKFLIVPSLRAQNIWAHEPSWTNSAGSTQAEQKYSIGEASLGGRIEYPYTSTAGTKFSPFLGVFEKSRFSSLHLDDYWATRMAAGLTTGFQNGWIWYLAGDIDGLGTYYKIWSANTRLSLPF